MSNFNPTHEFRGMRLEYISQEKGDLSKYLNNYYQLSGDMNAHYSVFRSEEGHTYVIPTMQATKLQPMPKPGEVWIYTDPDSTLDNFPLRGVDNFGRLFTLEERDIVWDPQNHSMLVLHQWYKKVLNADGTFYQGD